MKRFLGLFLSFTLASACSGGSPDASTDSAAESGESGTGTDCPSTVAPGATCIAPAAPCLAQATGDTCGTSGRHWLSCCSGAWRFAGDLEAGTCFFVEDAGQGCSTPVAVVGAACPAQGNACFNLCDDVLFCCSGTWGPVSCPAGHDAGAD